MDLVRRQPAGEQALGMTLVRLVRWWLEQIEALADGGSSEAGDSASPHSSVPQISLAGTLMTPQAVLLE